jgi:hypothetical protein
MRTITTSTSDGLRGDSLTGSLPGRGKHGRPSRTGALRRLVNDAVVAIGRDGAFADSRLAGILDRADDDLMVVYDQERGSIEGVPLALLHQLRDGPVPVRDPAAVIATYLDAVDRARPQCAIRDCHAPADWDHAACPEHKDTLANRQYRQRRARNTDANRKRD